METNFTPESSEPTNADFSGLSKFFTNVIKSHFIKAFLGLSVVCFFFTFFTVKCNDVDFVTFSGAEIICRQDVKPSQICSPMIRSNMSEDTNNAMDIPKATQPLALGAFILIVAGFILMFFRTRRQAWIGLLTSLIPLLLLIAEYIIFRQSVRAATSDSELSLSVSLSIVPNFAYYACTLLLLASSLFSLWMLKAQPKATTISDNLGI